MKNFQEILENRHDYARGWKERAGGKVMGYFEPYFPEELAYAAGILPVRILGKHAADDVTDRQMYGNCYPTRDMLRQFINGDYAYVDGLTNVEGCQWMYNAFQTAMNRDPELWGHYLFLPDYTDGRTSKTVTRSEFDVFKSRLEEWTGKEITDNDIDEAIDIYNENRKLLRQLYELRRADRPVIQGSEAMEIVMACQIMDKAEANVLLKELLSVIETREPLPDGVRIMLIGSDTHDTYLERMIEKAGAIVVIDEMDNGSSYFQNDVIPQKDRLTAL